MIRDAELGELVNDGALWSQAISSDVCPELSCGGRLRVGLRLGVVDGIREPPGVDVGHELCNHTQPLSDAPGGMESRGARIACLLLTLELRLRVDAVRRCGAPVLAVAGRPRTTGGGGLGEGDHQRGQRDQRDQRRRPPRHGKGALQVPARSPAVNLPRCAVRSQSHRRDRIWIYGPVSSIKQVRTVVLLAPGK